MQQSEHMSSSHVRWRGLLVAAAVLLILVAKAYGLQQRAFTEPFEAARLATSAEVDLNEPWPSVPSEQAEWALRHKQPAMILFYSTLCRPCMMMQALVQMVKSDYEPDVVFIEVSVDDPANAALVRWAKVGSIPASCFLTRAGEGKKIVGLMKQADLRAELARIAASE